MEQRSDPHRSREHERPARPPRQPNPRGGLDSGPPGQPVLQPAGEPELAGHQVPVLVVLRRALASRQALRHAIMLQEILGPPKALQPPGAELSAPADSRPLG